jgi:hypothetical protein
MFLVGAKVMIFYAVVRETIYYLAEKGMTFLKAEEVMIVTSLILITDMMLLKIDRVTTHFI